MPRQNAPMVAAAALAAAPDLGLRALWKMRLDSLDWLKQHDWAPDLAEDIGSRRWFRGLATMVGLGLAALSFWPDYAAIAASPAVTLDDAARDELRSQMIQPLGYGADSGKRAGATTAVTQLAAAPQRTTVQLTATLAQGDSFARMLIRAGVSEADAGAATALVAGVQPVAQIPAGTQVDLRLGAPPGPGQARPLEHLAFRARFDLDLEVSRVGG